jgi:hypothetical protein
MVVFFSEILASHSGVKQARTQEITCMYTGQLHIRANDPCEWIRMVRDLKNLPISPARTISYMPQRASLHLIIITANMPRADGHEPLLSRGRGR